jgi:hypothetical protein
MYFTTDGIFAMETLRGYMVKPSIFYRYPIFAASPYTIAERLADVLPR